MTPVLLLGALAREFGVGIEVLCGADRSGTVRAMRSVAMQTVRNQMGLSYPELARLFRRMDHTGPLQCVRRAPQYRERFPWIAQAADRAVERV